ncbi:EamA family transporter [Streptomyces sp. CMB-StM0423]|uniref:EamA family transporter n=1 Tax=Streptomyces sp. CMB-StM0423 TaxID=2059884 RepID=UPI000C70E75F|nr:EamA family transporter [Streptomyces sp. CMB-StM0423]AUH42590.1 EamA family transporter [Streptomyces sp. CMB-StM0423]
MTPLIAAAVLAAAVMHASWNAIAHGVKDQLVVFALIGVGDVLIAGTAVFFVPFPDAGAWPWLLASVAIHLVYMTLLMQSFRLGDFGQVYPIARGTAPLVVAAVAHLFLNERLGLWQTAGVAVACAGLSGIALWGLRGKDTRPHWPALAAAFATGLSIAAYTIVDGVGVRASGSAMGYTAWLVLLMGPWIPLAALVLRGPGMVRELAPVAVRGLLGGAISITAYGLVLWAQTRAPLAPIAALRESSIVVGAAIGAVFLKERFGGPRIVAACLMVAGIALVLLPA